MRVALGAAVRERERERVGDMMRERLGERLDDGEGVPERVVDREPEIEDVGVFVAEAVRDHVACDAVSDDV